MEPLDAATAALVGAGTAAVVGIGAQFIAHRLAVERDRRNQRRERLFNVIVEAATALYEPLDPPPPPDSNRPPPLPESLAALKPHLMDPSYEAFTQSTARGLTLLMIHFGHDHKLIDAYQDAWIACAKAEEWKALHFRLDPDSEERVAQIPELAKTLRAGQLARDRWMQVARAHVDSL